MGRPPKKQKTITELFANCPNKTGESILFESENETKQKYSFISLEMADYLQEASSFEPVFTSTEFARHHMGDLIIDEVCTKGEKYGTYPITNGMAINVGGSVTAVAFYQRFLVVGTYNECQSALLLADFAPGGNCLQVWEIPTDETFKTTPKMEPALKAEIVHSYGGIRAIKILECSSCCILFKNGVIGIFSFDKLLRTICPTCRQYSLTRFIACVVPGHPITCFDVQDEGQRGIIAAGTISGGIALFQMTQEASVLQPLVFLNCHDHPILKLTLHENNIYSSDLDGRVLKRHLDFMEDSWVLSSHRYAVTCQRWSSDFGGLLFSADCANTFWVLKEDNEAATREVLAHHFSIITDGISLEGTSFVMTTSADGMVKLSYLKKRIKFSHLLYSWAFADSSEAKSSSDGYETPILKLTCGRKSIGKSKRQRLHQSGSEFQLFPPEICVQCVALKRVTSQSFMAATGCNSGYLVVSQLPFSYLDAQIQAEKKSRKK